MACSSAKHLINLILTLALVLIVAPLTASAQAPGEASLKASLAKSRPDTNRVRLLLQLSNYYSTIEPQNAGLVKQAMAGAASAEKLSTSLSDQPGLGNSYLALAKAWRNSKDTLKAMTYLRRAKQLFLKNGDYRNAAETVIHMEEFYQYFGGQEYSVRAAYYEQAFPLFRRAGANDREAATLKILGDFCQLLGRFPQSVQYLERAASLSQYVSLLDRESIYDLLGSVYAITGELNKALQYGLLAIKMAEKGKDSTMQICAVYNRVGMTYYKLKQYAPARVYYYKSLAVAVHYKSTPTIVNEYINLTSILISLRQYAEAITLLKEVSRKYPPNDASLQAGLDFSMLKCYIKLGNLAEARFYSVRLEANSLLLDQNDNVQQIIQNALSDYYVAAGQDKPARLHIDRFKKLAGAHHNMSALANAYLVEATLDSAETHYAASYKNHRLFGLLKETVYNEGQNKKVAQLQIQFETDRKNQELKMREDHIKLLSGQARLQQTNLRQEKTTQKLLFGGALLLGILLVISFSGYRLKQRVNRQLNAQQTEISNKTNELTGLIKEKDHLLQEKEWLMKEIHHRVKNNLQIVISLLSTQSSYLDNDIAYKAIRESQHRMQSISLIHQKLYQSESLALVDIRAYINDLVNYLRDSFDTGTRIEFITDIDAIELDVTKAVPLGLILNEAITNAIKYAFPDNRSGEITIALSNMPDNTVVLKITDNGVGIPEGKDMLKSKSLGMSLMKGLSKQLGGSLEVTGGPGITITVRFINETPLTVS